MCRRSSACCRCRLTISNSPLGRRRLGWYDLLPLWVLSGGAGTALMVVPVLFAWGTGDRATAQAFLWALLMAAGIVALVGLAALSQRRANVARGLLSSLVVTYLLLPVLFALPVAEALPGVSLAEAYVEMVSSATTTGLTLFDDPGLLPPAVHLWRALVGWFGGLCIWVAAIAVLAPMRLGGFEVVLTTAALGRDGSLGRAATAENPMRRIRRFAGQLIPVYAGLTLALFVALLVAGEVPFIAFCHALSTLATSGISPVASLEETGSGRAGEAILCLFMALALSRTLFASDMPVPVGRRWWQDPELRLAAVLLVATPTVMLAHHWVAGAGSDADDLPAVLRAWWGGFAMTVSFLSTNGLISADWAFAKSFSEITTPGLIFLGLAMVGGGIATTAGGVKLLRVYILYRHGRFELARLVHPSLVTSPGHRARRFRIEAAYLAWLYFMIFALSLAATLLALTFTGVAFEPAFVLAIAALTTTGPIATVGGDAPIALASVEPAAQGILCLAMVLGRLETLALVALLNPEFWRS